jgi:transketolase
LFDDAAAAIAILQMENRRLTEENLAESAAHVKTCMEYENKILECSNKIEETKREDMKTLFDFALETVKSDKAERQHHEQTVNMFADVIKAIVSGYVDLANIAKGALRKHAPNAEYINTVERMADVNRRICYRITLDVSLLKSLEAHGLA